MRSLIAIVIVLTEPACILDPPDVPADCGPCTATIAASVDITLTSEQLNHATATLCRDGGECATGTLEVNFGNPVAQLQGIGNGVEVDIAAVGTTQVMSFSLSGAGSFFGGPVDGDVYTATITGSDGTMLLGASGTVAHYTDEQTNCFELAGCESASITLQ
ncbi:MAG TPA: hypothetical protein VH143_07530 [Kofleriaceae bacterium]|jgi:hypothetical protein|nr:hypothetical protein [Kofleriaceae bacterium]